MVKFEKLLERSSVFDFKFVNQRVVRFVGFYDDRVVSYVLTKSDVIKAINSYIETIHHFFDKPIRGEGMNFSAFKMYDLVPYFYSLLNLLMSVSGRSDGYHRFLPELRLTRFCHLPFGSEIVSFQGFPVLEIKCAYLHSEGSKSYQYVALLAAFHPIAYDTYEALRDKLQSLFPLKRVVLTVLGK